MVCIEDRYICLNKSKNLYILFNYYHTMMKKVIMILLIVIILLTSTVAAQIDPGRMAKMFCEVHGHKAVLTEDPKTSFYIFDDGEKCELGGFLIEECGEEYKKELSCAKKGELKMFRECCEGLYAPQAFGSSSCVKMNFLQKMWFWFASLF